MNELERRVAQEIERRGSVPFSEVMDLALYDPDHGFYATTGSAGGYRGDFLTSPEVGPQFGAVIARALDTWWRDAGEPDPFVVVEAGSGPGTLARSVLAARLACAPALRYVLVERSAAQRERHADYLTLETPAHAFAPSHDDEDEAAAKPDLPTGPIAVSLAELPRLDGPCIVLANELLDNLPFDLSGQRVGLDSQGLTFVPVPADTAPGVPVQHAAAEWIRDALALAKTGRVVVFDYCVATTAEARPRTYRGHERGDELLKDLGTKDITADVSIDQLRPPPTTITTQADWLRAHGIDELVEEGRRTWQERAAIGDLEAIKARSRINEAAALTDPAGLGAFTVLEWL